MEQGFSGSFVRKVGGIVEKRTSDQAFIQNPRRQEDLILLTRRLAFLPDIKYIRGSLIGMAFIQGHEGLATSNAFEAGQALRELHNQQDFHYPCHTDIQWLVDLANENLAHVGHQKRIAPELSNHYPPDALIHAEPSQFIEQPGGQIVFIDIEEIGWGSRYRDLGLIFYITELSGDMRVRELFLRGYTKYPLDLDTNRIRQIAGLTAVAYARFADTEKRLSIGLALLAAVECEQVPVALIDAQID